MMVIKSSPSPKATFETEMLFPIDKNFQLMKVAIAKLKTETYPPAFAIQSKPANTADGFASARSFRKQVTKIRTIKFALFTALKNRTSLAECLEGNN